MTYFELFLLALGLCFDTFAVSLTGGICMGVRPTWFQRMKIFCCFAFFQSGFTFAGWLLGFSFSSYIERFDHWIAFLLLLYIGGKMIYESLFKIDGSKSENSINLLDTKQLALMSIATSIDALAVGISLAMINLDKMKIGVGTGMIFVVTALASLLGMLGGNKLGGRFGKRSELIGGIILCAIGIKILLEHTLG